MLHNRVVNRYLTPAVISLMVTLITGVLIRMQWVWPDVQFATSRYLIHAHSHIALLGWIWLGITGLLIRSTIPESAQRALTSRGFTGSIMALLVIMTISFALQGYAAISIASSTIFVLMQTYASVHLIAHHNRSLPQLHRWFVVTSQATLLLANLGPLALSAGVFMGTSWVQFWITWYLHMQFTVWIPLALVTLLLVNTNPPSNESSIVNLHPSAYFLITGGGILSLEPLIRSATALVSTDWLGLLAAVCLSIGVLQLVWFQWQVHTQTTTASIENSAWKSHNMVMLLKGAGLFAFLVKSLLHIPAAWPQWGPFFTGSHALAIAFAHLTLLGAYTPLLLYLVSREIMTGTSQHFIAPTGIDNIRWGTIIGFLVATALMIALLFVVGLAPFSGWLPTIPIQETLIAMGITISGTTIAWWYLIKK